MLLSDYYIKSKIKLLSDPLICNENRELFGEFFEYEEHKLKRKNNLKELDDPCYKTLLSYIQRFKNTNRWFRNKPWTKLTRRDIQQVYDDLEEARIVNVKGERFADRKSYYNKVFKSKPFALAGKAQLSRELIEYQSSNEKEVRFVTEEVFLKMISVVRNPSHLLLFWLAWDIGENINTLLQLTKKEFIRQVNEDTHQPEYLVNLPRAKLKRSRQTRSEPTLYQETVKYADIVLSKMGENDLIFKFGYRQAHKLMNATAKKTNAVVMPTNEKPSWKDLRSGMACHLLKSGWTTDEVNFRLGHTPSSREIDVYVSYLAIDRRKPKKKIYDGNLQRIENELENAKQREKLFNERIRRQGEENETLKNELDETRGMVLKLHKQIQSITAKLH